MTKKKSIPAGEDLDLLKQDTDGRKIRFEYAGFSWVFEYRPVTWQEQWKGVEESWVVNVETDDAEFDVKGYYLDLLIVSEIGMPGKGPLTREYLEGLDPPVWAKLTSVIPSPNLDREVERVKKE